MRVEARTFWGPNPYCTRACVIFRFASLTPSEAAALCRFHAGVASHLSERYGFTPTQAPRSGLDGTLGFMAGAALFILNDVRGDLDYCGHLNEHGVHLVFVEFHEPTLARRALTLLLRLLTKCDAANLAVFDTELQHVWRRCRREHPDFQAHTLISAAKARGLYHAPLGARHWLHGMGAHGKRFFETSTLHDITQGAQTDKLSSKRLFAAVGAPTAAYRIVARPSELPQAIAEIGFPLVIKPIDRGAGRGVTAHIHTVDQARFAYAHAARFAKCEPGVMVERHVPGRDHRLLFVRGQFVACSSSVAPFVTGDGAHSVQQLIDAINGGRSRSLYRSGFLRPIGVDDAVRETLAVQGLSLQSVLPQQQRVELRRNSNLGGGGVANLIHHVHPEVIAVATRIARHSGLHSLGIDYITANIELPPAASGGQFTEVNKTPGAPLMLAGGMDIVTLGNHFLGEEPRNIELHLHVRAAEQLSTFLQAYRGECALLWPHTMHRRGTAQALAQGDPRLGLAQVLCDTSLHSLDIVTTPQVLGELGFPTEHLSEVIVEPSCMTQAVAATTARLGCSVRMA